MANDAAGGFIRGAQGGMDLVNKAVDIERRRFELEEKKQEVAVNKTQILQNEFHKAMTTKGKMREFQIEKIEGIARQFNLPFNPMMKEYLKDENNYTDIGTLLTTLSETNDPKRISGALGGFSELMADPITNAPKLAEAMAKIRADKEAHRLAAQSKKTETAGVKLTPGQEALDKAFAKTYEEEYASGKIATAVKGLEQLEGAKKRLGNVTKDEKSGETTFTPNEDITGPITGTLPDFANKFHKQGRNLIEVREAIHEVVQQNLRPILGAQFTEGEGDKLMARAFNPNLSPKENYQRLDRLITQVKKIAVAKQEAAKYFEANGTLAGYKGTLHKTITADDLLPTEDRQVIDNEVAIKQQEVQEIRDKLMKGDPENGISPMTGAQIDAWIAKNKTKKTSVAKGKPNGAAK